MGHHLLRACDGGWNNGWRLARGENNGPADHQTQSLWGLRGRNIGGDNPDWDSRRRHPGQLDACNHGRYFGGGRLTATYGSTLGRDSADSLGLGADDTWRRDNGRRFSLRFRNFVEVNFGGMLAFRRLFAVGSGVTHIAPGNKIDHILGDVRGVIPNALEVFGHHHQLESREHDR